jgi:hypothetical protein
MQLVLAQQLVQGVTSTKFPEYLQHVINASEVWSAADAERRVVARRKFEKKLLSFFISLAILEKEKPKPGRETSVAYLIWILFDLSNCLGREL